MLELDDFKFYKKTMTVGTTGNDYDWSTVTVVADDLDKCDDTFLRNLYTELLNTWESTHKDASDNNIIPYEIQEINPDKER